MDLSTSLLAGLVATLVLTTSESTFRGLGLTRMNLPLMLGTIFSADRDRAKWAGLLVHVINGWAFSLLYIALFHEFQIMTWWFGAGLGIAHAMFVLTVGMSLLPAVHPRMATIETGPDPTRQLEPPGFLALHYGTQTPVVILISHVVYGGVLGLFNY